MLGEAKWNSGQSLVPIFEKLNGSRQLDAEGAVSYQGFDLHSWAEVIKTFIGFPLVASDEVARGYVLTALFSRNYQKEIDQNSFIKEVNASIRQSSDAVLNKYIVATRLSYKGQFPIKTYSMGGVKFRIGSYPSKAIAKAHNAIIDDDHTITALKGKFRECDSHIQQQHYQEFAILITGHSEAMAFEKAWEQAERFRALLNFSNNFGRHKWAIGVGNNPVNDFRWDLLHTIHSVDRQNSEPHFWHETDFVQNTQPVDLRSSKKDPMRFIRAATKALSGNPLQEIVWQALARYNIALDRTDHSLAFRELWTVLESVTGDDTYRKGAHAKIPSKIASIYRDSEYHEVVLNHLRIRRNDITHNGLGSNLTEQVLNQCKDYVERTLLLLIYNSFNFQSISDFSQFLSLPSDKEGLDAMELQTERRRQFKLGKSKRLQTLLRTYEKQNIDKSKIR
jgi:hypothetical protein